MHITSEDGPRRRSGAHPDVLEFVAFARDELDRATADRLLEHCRSCPDCGDDLAATILLTSLSVRKRPPAWRRYAPVAAAAALVLVAGLYFALRPRPTPGPVSATGPAPATQVPPPATEPDPTAELQRRVEAAALVPETTVAELRELATAESIPPRLHEIWFDHPRPAAAGDAEVAAGARYIVQHRYREAVALLEESRRLDPASPEVAGMLGVARYLDGDHSDETVALLRAGVDARSFGTTIQWYLANLYLARGEIGRSADTLARLARKHSSTARRAQALLSRFPVELR